MQMRVGENMRSTGDPKELFYLKITEQQPVYSYHGSYLVELRTIHRYTYPSSFDVWIAMGDPSSYYRDELTDESAWFKIDLDEESSVRETRVAKPEYKALRLVPFERVPPEYQGWEKWIDGDLLPVPDSASDSHSTAALFDYFLDPLGTATINITVYGLAIAAIIYIRPTEWAYNYLRGK